MSQIIGTVVKLWNKQKKRTGLSLNHKDTTNKNKWQSNKLGRLLMAERTALVAAKNS